MSGPQAKHWQQAKLKTKREQEKAEKHAAQLPLFAEEIKEDVRTPEENYWKTRGLVANRFCSGEPYADRVLTLLAAHSRQAGVRRVRILNCLGLRADES